MFWLRCASWQTAAFGAPRRVSGDCQALSDPVVPRVGEKIPISGGGVHSTAVGYAAGQTANPTYEDRWFCQKFAKFLPSLPTSCSPQECCSGRTGATEAVQVVSWVKKVFFPLSQEGSVPSSIPHMAFFWPVRHVPKMENSYYTKTEVYDPEKISVVDLLRWFWESHDPTQGNGQGNDRGTQYRHLVEFRAFCTTRSNTTRIIVIIIIIILIDYCIVVVSNQPLSILPLSKYASAVASAQGSALIYFDSEQEQLMRASWKTKSALWNGATSEISIFMLAPPPKTHLLDYTN